MKSGVALIYLSTKCERIAWVRIALALVMGIVLPGVAQAQVPPTQDAEALRHMVEQTVGAGMSQADVLNRLRGSGLSRMQVRSRLQQMGYDPALADHYFDLLEQGGEVPTGVADTSIIHALQVIGVGVDTLAPYAGAYQGAITTDSLAIAALLLEDSLASIGEPNIFGRSLFRQWTSQFHPVVTGPVNPDYRLGPGDELVLVMTGDVELVRTLPVSREGYVVIPDVGQVFVNGLTLSALEDRLYDRLGRVYSGVKRGPEATTHFQVSLGRLRMNQVYVIGDVQRPNAYQVSAAATVLHALYLAGGPSLNGSFRRIEVRRDGKVVQSVDLYDYLLRGDDRSDIRLEHGDIIFVPPFERRVTIQGAVRRPAIYELVEGEDLRDAIEAAGGFDATAVVQRVQVDRILPPDERRPGVDRVLIDVDLGKLVDPTRGEISVHDGDLVQVFAISDERRNRVVITGGVRRPGLYQWAEGLTLQNLIERAQGLEERAYTPRALIYRLNEEDGSRRMIRVQLLAGESGELGAELPLADGDSVVVFDRVELRNPETVTISGFVKEPGTYPVAEGMTIHDLILVAGGFTEGADVREVEVARPVSPLERSRSTAQVVRVPLDRGVQGAAGTGVKALEPTDRAAVPIAVPVWAPDSAEFTLQHGDRVFVRRAPGYELPRTVAITGQVFYPGPYVLESRQERLLDLIRRAGGLTEEAHPDGLRVYRDGKLLATDLLSAIRDPASRYNLVLQPGDSLYVPEYDPTVLVTGAVTFESLVPYEPGRGIDYYVNRAGGYTYVADPGRLTITYQDGERAAVRRRRLFFDGKPRVGPGSTIYVPEKPEAERGGFNFQQFITSTTGMMTAVLTVLLAVDKLSQ